jgi:hypothetical protein
MICTTEMKGFGTLAIDVEPGKIPSGAIAIRGKRSSWVGFIDDPRRTIEGGAS